MTTPTTVREALTAALGTVEGIAAHPVEPATPSPMAGWPVWVSDDYATPDLWAETWHVVVLLNGTDLASAIEGTTTLRPAVAAALNAVPLVAVTRAQPTQLPVSDNPGGMPGLVFTLTIG